MRIQNEQLTLSSSDMSSNIQSDPIWLAHIVNYSIQTVFSGTPTGTFSLQGSNDFGGKDSQSPSVTNWTDLSITASASGAAGSALLVDKDCGYRWVRLIYTASSGSGTLNARYNVKGI